MFTASGIFPSQGPKLCPQVQALRIFKKMVSAIIWICTTMGRKCNCFILWDRAFGTILAHLNLKGWVTLETMWNLESTDLRWSSSSATSKLYNFAKVASPISEMKPIIAKLFLHFFLYFLIRFLFQNIWSRLWKIICIIITWGWWNRNRKAEQRKRRKHF